MLKKLTVFCVIFILLISVVGLGACNNGDELADYKTQAIASLETYAESKEQDNYTAENWETIKTIVENGKTTINIAKSKEVVDAAKTEARQFIWEVEMRDFKEVLKDNFSLAITVDKTKAQIGDKITVTATFKNLSGKNISIELTDWQTAYLLRGEMETPSPLEIAIIPEESEWAFNSIGVEVRHQMLIRKDEIIQQTFEFIIGEPVNHKVLSGVFFYSGENYKDFTAIKSDPIKIILLEGEKP
ncbi:MAG: hypothetical protein WC292_07205 [Clostridia bacterium]